MQLADALALRCSVVVTHEVACGLLITDQALLRSQCKAAFATKGEQRSDVIACRSIASSLCLGHSLKVGYDLVTLKASAQPDLNFLFRALR